MIIYVFFPQRPTNAVAMPQPPQNRTCAIENTLHGRAPVGRRTHAGQANLIPNADICRGSRWRRHFRRLCLAVPKTDWRSKMLQRHFFLSGGSGWIHGCLGVHWRYPRCHHSAWCLETPASADSPVNAPAAAAAAAADSPVTAAAAAAAAAG